MQRLVFHILYQDQDFIIQSDLFRRIQLPFHPHCVMISLGKLVDAANAFLDTFFALYVVDRRLLQCSGTEGRSAPSTAERLQEVVQLMRTPKTASTRRLAPLPTTQEANHGGTHWATAVVAGQCGEMFYRQRVDPATDARYCMECCAKLADGGQGSPPLEKIVDRFSHIGEGFTLTLRYAFVVELFCSGECYHTFFVIRRSGASRKELFMLEDGVCRSCKVHTQRVREALGCLPTEEASEHYFEASGGATDNERNMFERLSRKRQQRVISSTPGHLWEADHTPAVAEGGGEAELNNLQTLCLVCHYEEHHYWPTVKDHKYTHVDHFTMLSMRNAVADMFSVCPALRLYDILYFTYYILYIVSAALGGTVRDIDICIYKYRQKSVHFICESLTDRSQVQYQQFCMVRLLHVDRILAMIWNSRLTVPSPGRQPWTVFASWKHLQLCSSRLAAPSPGR